LSKEFKKLVQEPLEGFRIVKVDDADIYEWIVAIFGPPGTLYEGGYFKRFYDFQATIHFHRQLLDFSTGSGTQIFTTMARSAFPFCIHLPTPRPEASYLKKDGTRPNRSELSLFPSSVYSTNPTPSVRPMSTPVFCIANIARVKILNIKK